MAFSRFVDFENELNALVRTKSISVCWKILPFSVGLNEGYAENLAWRRTIFRKNYKKFVTTFHDFLPICQLWKWLYYIGTNKINQSVLKNPSVLSRMKWGYAENFHGDARFLAKTIKVYNDFSWHFPRLPTLKMGSTGFAWMKSITQCWKFIW